MLVHQVLHYLSDPGAAVAEAARLVAPRGRLLIVDFAPHDLEFLRAEHRHRRLGFSDEEMGRWLEEAGLQGPARPPRCTPSRAGPDRQGLDRRTPPRSGRAQERRMNLAEARAVLLSPLGPVARAGGRSDRKAKVSFEFFPPKTRGDARRPCGPRSAGSSR